MLLHEVAVRDWRGLSGRLGPFSPELNLITGPNESGKSRFFEAIRFALTESYKGKARDKQALQSWHGSEPPSVTLQFEVAGKRYLIHKQYLKQASARLEGDGRTLTDEDAEARLRALIGLKTAPGKKINDSDLGVWRLLLLPQGASRTLASADLNADTRSDLNRRLSRELGTLTISAADSQLLARVQEEWSRFFTAQGREKKEVSDLRDANKAAQGRLNAARTAYDAQQQVASALAEAKLQVVTLDARAEQAEEAARMAAEQAEQARKAQSTLHTLEQQQGLAEVERQRDLDARIQRQQTVEEIAELKIMHAAQSAQLMELAERQLAAEAALAQAKHDYQQANAALQAASLDAQRARLAEQYQSLIDTAAAIRQKLSALAEHTKAALAKRRELAELPAIDAATLEHLRGLVEAVTLARARRDDAAVSLEITARQTFAVDGEPLTAGSQKTLKIADGRAIALGDFATVALTIPSGGLAERVERLERAEQALSEALAEACVDGLAEARERLAQRETIASRIRDIEAAMQGISTCSSEELEQQLADVDGALAAITDHFAPSEQDEHLNAQAAAAAEAAARDARTRAETTKDLAQATLDELRPTVEQHRSAVQTTESRLQFLEESLADEPTAEAIDAACRASEQRMASILEALAVQRVAFAQLGGEDAIDAAERQRRAAEQLRQRVVAARETVVRLETELKHHLDRGSYEALQDAEAQCHLAEAVLTRTASAARTAERLKHVLEHEQRALVGQLLAPVRARVAPYVRLIFPEAEVHTDEALRLDAFSTRNTEEHFEDLSGGAQEQFSLMTRIGLAEVLADGEKLPLILDDALVNSDAGRIARVHAALDRAAKHLQILLFTCHEPFFDGLGAQYVEQLRAKRS